MTEIVALSPAALTPTQASPFPGHVAAWLLGYRSEHTRRAYARDLAAFTAWCAEHDLVVLEVRRAHIDAYARTLESTGAAPTTVARRLSALGSFFAYLVAEDVLHRSPVTHVRRPQTATDSQTTGLDRAEVRALIAAARGDSPRAYALLSLLAGNGLRIGEALALDVSDLGTERGHRVLRVTRKGGRRATVPLAPVVADAVDTYLGGRADGPLFATASGRRLDEPYAFRLVRRLARHAGIGTAAQLSPHSLRHAFVTLALDSGASLRDVQDAAGHADPRTTRRYDRARHNLDRHPAYALAGYLAD